MSIQMSPERMSPEQLEQAIPQTPILVGYRGSVAHGMYIPNSDPDSIDDVDIMAVCIPPMDYYFAFETHELSRGTKEKWVDQFDCVSYELRKFIGLLANSNPNVLALLYIDPEYYISMTAAGRLLVDNRELFMSKRIYAAFTGYAHGQLHRMTHQVFEGYMGQKRKSLVERYGFDCKCAAHCIRLLRMGAEFLEGKGLQVNRCSIDAVELLDIKCGNWSLEQVQMEASRLFAAAKDAYAESTLPEMPDPVAIRNLSMKIFETHYGKF